MNEESAYAQVAAEVAARDLKSGLWTKALADSVGNENVAKSLYLKYRARQLLAEYAAAEEYRAKQEIQAKATAIKKKAVAILHNTVLHNTIFAWVGAFCGLISVILVLCCVSMIHRGGSDVEDIVGMIVGAVVFGATAIACFKNMK